MQGKLIAYVKFNPPVLCTNNTTIRVIGKDVLKSEGGGSEEKVATAVECSTDYLNEVRKMSEEFFSEKERATLLRNIQALSDIDIVILNRDTKEPLSNVKTLNDRQAFFAKAKLWRVVQEAVRSVFLEQLKSKQLTFVDDNGFRYFVSGFIEPEPMSKIDITEEEKGEENAEE